MITPNEEFNALMRRAEANRNLDGMPVVAQVFWIGYGAALRELQSGRGKKWVAKYSAAQQAASAPVLGNSGDEAA